MYRIFLCKMNLTQEVAGSSLSAEIKPQSLIIIQYVKVFEKSQPS